MSTNPLLRQDDTEPRGSCQLIVYLYDFTDGEVERLSEHICDWLVDAGVGVEGEDSPVRALVGSKPAEFPDLTKTRAIKAFLADHSLFVIPAKSEGDDDE